jgi:hypothetical protein
MRGSDVIDELSDPCVQPLIDKLPAPLPRWLRWMRSVRSHTMNEKCPASIVACSDAPEDAAAELRVNDAVKKLDRLFEEEATRLLEAWDEEVRRLAPRYGA